MYFRTSALEGSRRVDPPPTIKVWVLHRSDRCHGNGTFKGEEKQPDSVSQANHSVFFIGCFSKYKCTTNHSASAEVVGSQEIYKSRLFHRRTPAPAVRLKASEKIHTVQTK